MAFQNWDIEENYSEDTKTEYREFTQYREVTTLVNGKPETLVILTLDDD